MKITKKLRKLSKLDGYKKYKGTNTPAYDNGNKISYTTELKIKPNKNIAKMRPMLNIIPSYEVRRNYRKYTQII